MSSSAATAEKREVLFRRNYNDILGNPWNSVGNGHFEPNKGVCGRRMSGDEKLGSNS